MVQCNMKWKWFLNEYGDVEVYYDGVLCWELEGFAHYSEKELNLKIKELIMREQHYLFSDSD